MDKIVASSDRDDQKHAGHAPLEGHSKFLFESLLTMKKVFLSYSSADREHVRKISEMLKAIGVGAWMDEREMRPGMSIRATLRSAIANVAHVVAMLSKSALQSAWVREELKWAVEEEDAHGTVKLIPCLLESVEIPEFLQDRIFCDFTAGDVRGVAEVLRGVDPACVPIILRINAAYPFCLDEESLKNELQFLFSSTVGTVRLRFLIDASDLMTELRNAWRRCTAPDPDKTSAGKRRNAELTLSNLAFALTEAANVYVQTHSRSAATPFELVDHLQRIAQLVLWSFWRLVGSSTNFDDLLALKSASVEQLVKTQEILSELGAGHYCSPPPSVEAWNFNCPINDLKDIELAGREKVCSVRLWIPGSALPLATWECMEQGFHPMNPSAEIMDYVWARYFMPGMALRHVQDCSRTGLYLGAVPERFSLKMEDYSRVGFA